MQWIGFDFDGTIADTRSVIAGLYNDFLSDRYGGKKISLSEIEHLKKLSLIDKIHYLKISPLRLPFFVRAARKEIGRNIEKFPLYEGIDKVLFQLHELNYRIAILSSNNADTIRKFLMFKNISCFDVIFCDKGASLFVKSQTIKSFIKKQKILKNNFIYIGDEVRDIISCQKEGVAIISVLWGWDSEVVLRKANPEYIASTPSELIDIIYEFFEGKTY